MGGAADAQEWLDRLWDDPDTMVSVHDENGRYVGASPGASGVAGHDPSSLVGRQAYPLVHPEDIPIVAAHHDGTLQGRYAQEWAVYRLRAADGAYRWLRSQTRTGRDPDTGGRVIVMRTRRVVDVPDEACIQEIAE